MIATEHNQPCPKRNLRSEQSLFALQFMRLVDNLSKMAGGHAIDDQLVVRSPKPNLSQRWALSLRRRMKPASSSNSSLKLAGNIDVTDVVGKSKMVNIQYYVELNITDHFT